MYIQIQNENFGYDVTTYGDYVVASNPATLRFDWNTSSFQRTGSVDYFRYNKNTDEHDYIGTLYQPPTDILTILSRDNPNPLLDRGDLMTERTMSYPSPRSASILIDKNDYTRSLDDGFGLSLDLFGKNLIVGSPYFTQIVQTSASLFTASLATAHIFNLGLSEYLNFTPDTNLKIFTFNDPDVYNANWQSESFGRAVTINSTWAAVGSPAISSSRGMVYIYRAEPTTSYYSGSASTKVTWSLYQKLEPSGGLPNAGFGYSLKLNKCTCSVSNSLVVGCENPYNQQAYYFECLEGRWSQSFVFVPDKTIQPMTFGPYLPHNPVMNESNGFGRAVSQYGDAVIIGEPFDRMFYEYSGSTVYQQGSAYIFERCPKEPDDVIFYPKMPNDQIAWFVVSTTAPSMFVGSGSTNEGWPHAVVKVGNKLYGGGWDGKLFVLNDPDGDLTNQNQATCIAGDWISQGAYCSGTGYLYFINAKTYGTGSIIQVDPSDITKQKVIVQGLPGASGPPLFGPANLPPLAADDKYLYTMTGGYIYKWNASNGAVVAQVPAAASMHGGGVFSPDGQWVYFCGGSRVYKINTTTLSSSYTSVYGGFGFYFAPSGSQQMYYFPASLVDDMAYLNGYLYVAQDQSAGNFGIWKINADDLTWTPYTSNTAWDVAGYGWSPSGSWSYPTKYGGWAIASDGKDVYLLQGNEIWIYPDGNLDDGPVRYPIINGANEIWFTDGGNVIYTVFDGSRKVYSYKLPQYKVIPKKSKFKQVFKTYGNEYILKNNHLGWSVDIYGDYAVAGIPKTNADSLTSCYIGGTLEQMHQCGSDLENLLDGQAMLIKRNTSSMDWELLNIYQKKKKYLSPYRSYGFDVAIADKSMVVGAPIYLFDSNRQINITTTASNNVTLDDVTGKAYIYNLHNLRHDFHVGNVFYRNGKIILMTSGSIFDGLFFNPVNTYDYEYDLQFKGQHTIFEKQIVCTVNPGEFNVSTNPTAVIRPTASLDVNGNGRVDFQDIDIILRYMQYKNTSLLGVPVSTDWSSSVVINDDEKSLLLWYQQNYNDPDTGTRTSESIYRWETTDTWMQDVLDLNEDNKIDIRDMNIMWKYFSNRLTQENYAAYITPACKRRLFSDIIDYMDFLTQKSAKPLIDPQFAQYEHSVALDKTGSYLAPVATTIGLYSGLDLVAVAKLGSPIKITPELPINFVVKMDF